MIHKAMDSPRLWLALTLGNGAALVVGSVAGNHVTQIAAAIGLGLGLRRLWLLAHRPGGTTR